MTLKRLINGRGHIKTAGRNNTGRITAFHRGGGLKKKYKQLTFFKQPLSNIYQTGIIQKILHDPFRTAPIATIKWINKTSVIWNLVLAAKTLHKTKQILKIPKHIVQIPNEKLYQPGNIIPIKFLIVGTKISNIGGKLAKAAGSYCTIVQHDKHNKKTKIQLPSGKIAWIPNFNNVMVGPILENKKNSKKYKAGQTRWKGIRPTVRGVAMNPIDHPHGGGEGKTSGGRPSSTPWGKTTK